MTSFRAPTVAKVLPEVVEADIFERRLLPRLVPKLGQPPDVAFAIPLREYPGRGRRPHAAGKNGQRLAPKEDKARPGLAVRQPRRGGGEIDVLEAQAKDFGLPHAGEQREPHDVTQYRIDHRVVIGGGDQPRDLTFAERPLAAVFPVGVDKATRVCSRVSQAPPFSVVEEL